MELKIVKFFNRLGRGTVVDFLTRFASSVFLLAVSWTSITILIFLFAEDGKNIATALVIAAGLHFMISEGLFKYLLLKYFKKIRPYIAHPDEIFPIGSRYSDSSFPSSHVSANVAILTVIFYFYPNLWSIIFLFVTLIAFARLHNGMHYLMDVVAGVILGIMYGSLVIYLMSFDFLKNLV